VRKSGWFAGVTGYQWLVLLVAWLGWVFDAMDATIYALVMHPALTELLRPQSHGQVSQDLIGYYGGIIFSIFLVGWAVGGVVFGLMADRFGRTRTLIVTVLIYALFTGMAALSGTWWQLGLYRFLTALGIGGEWAAGAALVAEVWPEDKRTKAAGLLQSAWAVGFFLAALINLLLRNSGWRPIFVVGIAPALVALLVRLWVKEPDRWLRARPSGPGSGSPGVGKLIELFSAQHIRSTLIGSGLAFVAVFGLWGATNWTPILVRSLPELRGYAPARVTSYVSYATMMLNAGALVGYLVFSPLADRFGRRVAFGFMCLGSLIVLPLIFLVPRAYGQVLTLLPLLGFFNNGIFSGFPIYLPELYPTRIRATGAGFCFNIGRVLASTGPVLTGLLVGWLGTYGRAASSIAVVYVLGLLLLPFARETRGQPLPE
jgi:MFS family permease